MLGLGLPIRINKRASGGSPTPPPSRDADTTAFMNAISIPDDSTLYYSGTAQEITGEGMWDAVDTCVKALKADSLWTPLKAFYPFVGGTASTHERNLKDPADTNAAHRIIWGGGVTHGATGAKGNATNGFGDTHIYPPTDLTLGQFTGGVYLRDDVQNTAAIFGAHTSGSVRTLFSPTHSTLGFFAIVNNASPFDTNPAITSADGHIQVMRETTTQVYGYIDNVEVVNGTTSTATALPMANITLFAENVSNAAKFSYDNREISAAYFIDDTLTTSQRAALNTAINNLQTSLFRNV